MGVSLTITGQKQRSKLMNVLTLYLVLMAYWTIGFGIVSWLYKPEHGAKMIIVLFLWPLVPYYLVVSWYRDRRVFRL